MLTMSNKLHLLDLPQELFDSVLEYLFVTDIQSIRLTCHALCHRSNREFGTRQPFHRMVDFTAPNLNRLEAISQAPWAACQIRDIRLLSGEEWPHLRQPNEESLDRSSLVNLPWAQQFFRIMAKLPNACHFELSDYKASSWDFISYEDLLAIFIAMIAYTKNPIKSLRLQYCGCETTRISSNLLVTQIKQVMAQEFRNIEYSKTFAYLEELCALDIIQCDSEFQCILLKELRMNGAPNLASLELNLHKFPPQPISRCKTLQLLLEAAPKLRILALTQCFFCPEELAAGIESMGEIYSLTINHCRMSLTKSFSRILEAMQSRKTLCVVSLNGNTMEDFLQEETPERITFPLLVDNNIVEPATSEKNVDLIDLDYGYAHVFPRGRERSIRFVKYEGRNMARALQMIRESIQMTPA
jgi:hypothetical protein